MRSSQAPRQQRHQPPTLPPDPRTVVEFVLTGVGGGRAWLVLDRGSSTACQIDPGYNVDLVLHGENREMHRWLVGCTTFRTLEAKGHARIIGPSRLARAFPTWFDTTMFGGELTTAGRARPRSLTA